MSRQRDRHQQPARSVPQNREITRRTKVPGSLSRTVRDPTGTVIVNPDRESPTLSRFRFSPASEAIRFNHTRSGDRQVRGVARSSFRRRPRRSRYLASVQQLRPSGRRRTESRTVRRDPDANSRLSWRQPRARLCMCRLITSNKRRLEPRHSCHRGLPQTRFLPPRDGRREAGGESKIRMREHFTARLFSPLGLLVLCVIPFFLVLLIVV